MELGRVRANILHGYAARARGCLAPSAGIAIPPQLAAEVHAQGLELAEDTRTDGNCGVHAFGIGLIEEAKHSADLSKTARYKTFFKSNRSSDGMLQHLRSGASTWMKSNGTRIVWEGMPYNRLAVMMAGVSGRTFADQVRCVSTYKEWIDCSCLLSLACFFHVDVVIFQEGVEPAMLGTSMMDATPFAVLPLAMVNDVHFWGLRPIRVAVPHVQPPNGDMIRVPLVDRSRGPSSDDEVDLHAWHQQVIEPARPQLADTTVEKEFDLCRCLMNWQPFAAPPSPLVDAIGRLTAEPLPTNVGLRCLLRQTVIGDLAYEAEYGDALPLCMRHHAAARRRLRNNRVVQVRHPGKALAVADSTGDLIPGIDDLGDSLTEPCGLQHTCLDVFRANPQIVRNWRILWRSLPPAARREALLVLFRNDLAQYRACEIFIYARGCLPGSFYEAYQHRRVLADAGQGHQSSLSLTKLGV